MSRLRQYFANRYSSAEATNSEFENIIRYLNSAEIGNLTLGELLDKLFDDAGNLNIGLQFRFNPATGIEVMTDPTSQNWDLIVGADEIRGASGLNVGTIEAPLFSNRQDFTSTTGQTVFSYTMSSATSGNSSVMVWVNGALQAQTSYAYNDTTKQVTLGTAPANGSLVSIATIRTSPATAYRRADLVASSGQVTFPFPFADTEEIVVYRNGILQREGGGYDYIKSSTTGTITMTTSQTAGNIITIICITNSAIKDVAGLMLEDKYASAGLILLDKINIADGAIAQAKISGLVTALASRAKISVSSTAPTGPLQGDLWVNTSYAVPTLLFYDGVRWLNSSPNGMIPLPLPANALQFVRLNSTATALEYAPFDTSGLVATNQVGAANGVCALNAQGKVPSSSVPEFAQRSPITGRIAGSIANQTYVVGHINGTVHAFDSITCKLTSGTCTVQLQVGGNNVGSTIAVTSTTTKLAITPTTIDSTTAPRDVSLVVTGGATPVDLTYHIGNTITG